MIGTRQTLTTIVSCDLRGARARTRLLAQVGLSILIPLMAASAALAQDASDGIPEVTVTAQKRTEKVQDVPISLGVVSAATIEQQGIQNVNDIAGMMPNIEVILPFGPQMPQFSIRGVTETDFNPNQSSPIAMYVDGVFKSVPALQALQIFDTDRVEVLKGAQGTLQGRNATGGAINIYSNKPIFDTEGMFKAGIGNYGRYETEGMLNAPIIDDKLAVRAAWTFTNVDGYFHNPLPNAPYSGNLTGVFDYAGRVSVLAKPTEDLDILIRVAAGRSNPVNYGEYSKYIQPQGEGIPPGYLGFAGIPANAYSATGYTRQGVGYYDTEARDVHRREIKSHGISAEINYNLTDTLKLTSITGYDQGQWNTNENDGGAPFEINIADYFSRINSFQEEARLTSSFNGPLNFVFGTLYGQESLFLNEYTSLDQYQPAIVNIGGVPTNLCLSSGSVTCTARDDFNQKRIDYATYLNTNYNITDDLKATVGVRYTADSVGVQNYNATLGYYDNTLPGNPFTVVNTIPGGTDPNEGATNQTVTNHKWIGKAGLDYHITPDNMVYASWSLGFRGSAYTGSAIFPASIASVKPEELIDYELGSKNDFFDHRLQVNIGAFYYIYRNQQFAGLNSEGLSQEVNLPKVNSRGFETDMTAKPVKNLTLNFSTGYTYAIYSSGQFQNPVTFVEQDITGNRVEEAPRWSLTGSLDWKPVNEEWGQVDVYFDGRGMTKQYENTPFNNDPVTLEKGYSILDARVTTTVLDGSTAFSVWVENLMDTHYDTVLYDTEYLGYTFAERGTPRTFGVTGTYRF